jgi:hypothetical protein
MAGFVLAKGSMSSNQSGEGDIRCAPIEADLGDCMVALPGQLFYSTQIPVRLWYFRKIRAARVIEHGDDSPDWLRITKVMTPGTFPVLPPPIKNFGKFSAVGQPLSYPLGHDRAHGTIQIRKPSDTNEPRKLRYSTSTRRSGA